MATRHRDDEDERGSRGRGDDDRGSRRSRDEDEDRGSRSRSREDDDRGSRRSSRDEDDRGSRRSRDEDDDRGSRGSSRGGSGYTYERRSAESLKERAEKQARGDFDRFVKDNVKQWKPNDGDNRIRILPPTWPKPGHYGYDLKVHYGVGADRQSYLCLHAMQGKDDPIYEAYQVARRELTEDENNKDLKEYVRNLKAKPRVGIYLVDRDHEKEGVQFWAMPAGVDEDIYSVMSDKRTGEVLNIDDPEDGYDIEFTKTGKGINTEYKGIAIARRSSPLGKSEWLEWAVENPIPDQLVFFEYDHIAKVFGGGPSKSRGESSDRDERPSRSRESDDRGGSRDRDRDEERGKGRLAREDDPPARGGRERERDSSGDEPTWETVHEMTKSELEDLIDQKKLDINPKKAKDTEDLADWICEELKLKKAEKKVERRRESDDDAGADKLADMRRRRERD